MNLRLPFVEPRTFGRKEMRNVCDPSDGMFAVCGTTENTESDVDAEAMAIAKFPVFVTRTLSTRVLPTFTFPKSILDRERENVERIPVPVAMTESGDPAASCMNMMFVALGPVDVGMNVMVNHRLLDGGTTLADGKTSNSSLDEVTDDIVSGAPPLLVTFTLSILVEFTTTLPKSFEPGLTENSGTTPAPDTGTADGDPSAL